MEIIKLNRIKKILKSVNIVPLIEEGFVAYANGNAIIPAIGELIFKDPPGDVHIKYGYIVGDEYYIIKIASGFYENPKLNLPSSNGLMLLFSQKTGELLTILLDEGYLTNLRTAAAGAIAAKYLAPTAVNRIGVIGTGTQARLQLHYLPTAIQCRQIMIFGRDYRKLAHFKIEVENQGWFKVEIAESIEDITSNCNFIVTTTSSSLPILLAKQINAGTHITAVGADTPAKQELDENIFAIADIIVADSICQCVERGEIAHAIRKKIINTNQIIELGNIISDAHKGRINDDQISIVDLTGIALQDLQIAKAIFQAVKN